MDFLRRPTGTRRRGSPRGAGRRPPTASGRTVPAIYTASTFAAAAVSRPRRPMLRQLGRKVSVQRFPALGRADGIPALEVVPGVSRLRRRAVPRRDTSLRVRAARANRHPGGGSTRSGGRPPMIWRRLWLGCSSFGIDLSRPRCRACASVRTAHASVRAPRSGRST